MVAEMPSALRKKLSKRQASPDLRNDAAETNSGSDNGSDCSNSIEGVPRLMNKTTLIAADDLTKTPPPPPKSNTRRSNSADRSPKRKTPAKSLLERYKQRASSEKAMQTVKPGAEPTLDINTEGKHVKIRETAFTEELGGGVSPTTLPTIVPESSHEQLTSNPLRVSTDTKINDFAMAPPTRSFRPATSPLKPALKQSKSAEQVRSLPWDDELDHQRRRRTTRSDTRRQERIDSAVASASPTSPEPPVMENGGGFIAQDSARNSLELPRSQSILKKDSPPSPSPRKPALDMNMQLETIEGYPLPSSALGRRGWVDPSLHSGNKISDRKLDKDKEGRSNMLYPGSSRYLPPDSPDWDNSASPNSARKPSSAPDRSRPSSTSPDKSRLSPTSANSSTTHLTLTPPKPTLPFSSTSSVRVLPPLYTRGMEKGWEWTSTLASTSRPSRPFGWTKRWTCCNCQAETMVEQGICANLQCGHERCGERCKMIKGRDTVC